MNQYSVVMVDEAHERSADNDVLLGLLKKILQKRQDLRVVIASASVPVAVCSHTQMNVDLYKRYFRDVAYADVAGAHDALKAVTVFTVQGRQYPVDVL